MFVEFQLSARAFLDAQLLTLQSQKVDFSQPFAFGSQQYVIDHIEYGANRLMQGDSQGVRIYYDLTDPTDYQLVMQRQLQLIQPVTVYIASLSDVLAHPNSAPSFFITVSVNLHYTLQYQMTPLVGDALTAAVASDSATSVDTFSIQYYYTEFLGVEPLPAGQSTTDIQIWIDAYMAAHNTGVSSVLGLVTNLFSNDGRPLKNQPLPVNTGMSIDPDLSRISFRQEPGLGVPGDPVAWQQYFNGVFPDRMGGASWAVFLDKGVVDSVTQNKIYDGLVKKTDTGFTLVSGVSSAYANNGGTPTVTSQFGGNVDTPICTIYTDVQIVSAMRVDKPNTLTSDGQISWNTHGGACEVTAAVLGATIGFGVDLIMPWMTSLINPVTGAIAGVATVLYVEAHHQPDLPSIHDCVAASSTELVCTTTFPTFSTPLGSLNFTSILAFDDGISLQGQLLAIPVGTASAEFTVSDPLNWVAPSMPCSAIGPETFQAIAGDPQAYAELSATITITANGLAPVYILSVNPNGDALGLVSGHFTQVGDQAPATITVEISYPGPAYYASPYAIELLIATSGGIRLVSLGTIPVLTQGAIDSMLVGVGSELNKCSEKVVNQFQYYRKYAMRWAIDPYQGQKVFHSYGIAIRGLAEGERVSIAEANGRVLQTAFAREDQPMFLDALMDPLSYDGLELVPERADVLDQIREAFSSGGKKSLDVTGQLIVTRSQFPIPARTTQISATFSNNRPTLFVRTGSRMLGYDLSNPAIPRQVSAQPLAVGNQTTSPAQNQIRSRGSLFAVSEGQIEEYRLADRQKPVLVRSHEMPGVRQIVAPPVSQGNSLLVRFHNGTDRLYQFFKDRSPVMTIEYHSEPWWLHTVTFNGLLLRWDKKTATVSVNEYGTKKLLA